MIKSFMIPDRQFIERYTARYVTDRAISGAILENNESFDMWRDVARMALVVECENKPRDLLVYGLRWIE